MPYPTVSYHKGQEPAHLLSAETPARSSPAISVGGAILALYFGIFYALPAVLTAVFGGALDTILLASPNYVLGTLLALFAFAACWFLIPRAQVMSVPVLATVGRLLFSNVAIAFAAVIFFGLSFYFWQNFGLSFRQTGDRIGASGPIPILYYIFQSYVIVALLVLSARPWEELFNSLALLVPALLAITLGIFLSLQAASNIVVMAVAFLILLRVILRQEILRTGRSLPSPATLLLIGIAGLGALFVGIANKLGVEAAVGYLQSEPTYFIEVFQRRISYHLFTASFHSTFNFFDFELGFQALSDVSTNFRHRLDVILGNPTTFNEIASVKRLNYEEISFFIRERTGTSPGFVGGLFFYPLWIFVAPFVLFVYSCVIKTFASFYHSVQPSLLEYIFIVLLLGNLVDGSIDTLNPFDPAFLRLVLLVLAASAFAKSAAERAS